MDMLVRTAEEERGKKKNPKKCWEMACILKGREKKIRQGKDRAAMHKKATKITKNPTLGEV